MARTTLQKYWVTRDGVLGTVHRNRNGEEVDFRPMGEVVACFAFPWNFSIGDISDEDVYGKVLESMTVWILPGKGVKCEPLQIKHGSVVHGYRTEEEGRGCRIMVKHADGMYEGRRYIATEIVWGRPGRWLRSSSQTFVLNEARRRARFEIEFARDRKKEENPKAVNLTPKEATKIGCPVFKHLCSDRQLVWQKAAEKVRGRVLKHLGLSMNELDIFPEWFRSSEKLRWELMNAYKKGSLPKGYWE